MFLSVMIVVIICAIYVIFRPPKNASVQISSVDREEDINLFYYRTVPGLKRAEELGLVTPIHKRIEIPNNNSELKIDRIWYNEKNTYIFYHVENTSQVAFLGGALFQDEKDTSFDVAKLWEVEAVGRPSERGINYKNNFYSCVRIPSLTDDNGNNIEELSQVFYRPYLVIADKKDIQLFNESKGILFEPIKFNLTYNYQEQPNEQFKLDTVVEFEKTQLNFYKITIGSSENNIYFLSTNDNQDIIYNIKGTLITDKGEQQNIDVYPEVITEYPYHYVFDIEPFNYLPDSIELKMASIDLISKSQLAFELDTKSYSKKKGSYHVQKDIDYFFNTAIQLEQIKLDKDNVWIGMRYIWAEPDNKPYPLLKAELPIYSNNALILSNISTSKHAFSNIISVRNETFSSMDKYADNLGMYKDRVDRFSFAIPRQFWNNSKTIYIDICNLTYQVKLDRNIMLELNEEY